MIDKLLEKAEFYAETEKIFAFAAIVMSVIAFISCLAYCRKKKVLTTHPAAAFKTAMVATITVVVFFYGSSIVFAEENTDEVPILMIEDDDWPEKTEFSEKTRVKVNADMVLVKIRIQEIYKDGQSIPAEEKYDNPKKLISRRKVYGTEDLVFDIPDGSAFRFVIQACLDGNEDESIAFVINKLPLNGPDDPVEENPVEEKPEEPETTSVPSVTPMPTDTPVLTIEPDEPSMPDHAELPVETEAAGPEDGVPEHITPTPADSQDEKVVDLNEKPVQTETDKEKSQESKKEDYTLTIHPDGSVFTVSSETKQAVEDLFLSEPTQLTIVEINPERLESRNVSYTLNGETQILEEGRDYSVTEEKTEEGWRYTYRLEKDIFKEDGYYQVNITSSDNEGNKNNNKTAGTNIQFVLDKTAPEIIISGLENDQTYTDVPHVYYLTIRDNTGPGCLTIEKNGTTEEVYDYQDGNWVNTQNEEEILIPDGGTLKLELDTKGKYCDYRFTVSDKSLNTACLEILNVRTKSNKTKWLFALVAGLCACGGFLVIKKRKKQDTHNRVSCKI